MDTITTLKLIQGSFWQAHRSQRPCGLVWLWSLGPVLRLNNTRLLSIGLRVPCSFGFMPRYDMRHCRGTSWSLSEIVCFGRLRHNVSRARGCPAQQVISNSTYPASGIDFPDDSPRYTTTTNIRLPALSRYIPVLETL